MPLPSWYRGGDDAPGLCTAAPVGEVVGQQGPHVDEPALVL